MTDPNDDALDIDIPARTLFGEARGEGGFGMQAVANVIMNRCKRAAAYMLTHGEPHPLFGDGTPASACKMPWQFSCWNAKNPNCKIVNDADASDPAFASALKIAADVINDKLSDLTSGATHYYDRRTPDPPDWAKGKKPCQTIGHHVFFNNID